MIFEKSKIISINLNNYNSTFKNLQISIVHINQ
jgi:hypothetical protein